MKSVILALVLMALSAFGVSRVGGGKVNSYASGFELEVPQEFLNMEQYPDVIVANGPMLISNSTPMLQFIQIREFKNYYAAQATLSRAEMETYFTSRRLVKLTGVPDPCMDAYAFDNRGTTGLVVTWGDGKGVTLTGPSSPLVKSAVESILQSMTLVPGACAWN